MFEMVNFAEQFQDWIANNCDISLTVGKNFVLGNLLNVYDFDKLKRSHILLSMFEEGGSIISRGRRTQQERTFRFIFRGNYGQEAINYGLRFVSWLRRKKTFETDSFRAWLSRVDKLPTVVSADQDGVSLADLVITLNVWFKVE